MAHNWGVCSTREGRIRLTLSAQTAALVADALEVVEPEDLYDAQTAENLNLAIRYWVELLKKGKSK